MRKLKERKLAKSASYSPSNSPNPGGPNSNNSISGSATSNGNNNSNNCNGSSNARLKSLSDALTSDNLEHHERSNNSPSSRHPSPARAGTSGEGGRRGNGGSPPKRSKKQTAKHRNAVAEQDKPQNHRSDSGSSAATVPPPVLDKHVIPLPGFQQAFGSTEIGKFSEAFFNSSPGPNSGELHHLPPEAGGGQHHPHHHQHHHPHPHAHQLIMDSLATAACESDVDTLSPQPCWEPTGPGDPFDGGHPNGTTAFNLQIGTSFHPSYYESSSATYSATSDHVVDSPLGSYFSEMTCNEYVT